MKMFPLDLDEMQDDSVAFEDSSFFDYFWNHHLLAAVFQEPYGKCPYGEIIFRGFKRITMPESFIEGEAQQLFMGIRLLILEDRLRRGSMQQGRHTEDKPERHSLHRPQLPEVERTATSSYVEAAPIPWTSLSWSTASTCTASQYGARGRSLSASLRERITVDLHRNFN